jgi:hypothetical protein
MLLLKMQDEVAVILLSFCKGLWLSLKDRMIGKWYRHGITGVCPAIICSQRK